MRQLDLRIQLRILEELKNKMLQAEKIQVMNIQVGEQAIPGHIIHNITSIYFFAVISL